MRHKNGTLFQPTSAREMTLGRKVLLPDPSPHQWGWLRGRIIVADGETCLVWIEGGATGDLRETSFTPWTQATKLDRIRRIDSLRGLRLYSGDGGSISEDKRGYIRVQLGKGHPLVNTGGWQYAHRLQMAALIGRKLKRRECVAHRNRKKRENLPCNLLKLTPRTLGQRSSKPQRRVPPGLRRGGQWVPGVVMLDDVGMAVQANLWG